MIKTKYIRPMWGQPGEYNFNGDDLHYKKVSKSLYLDENNEFDGLDENNEFDGLDENR
jgi:hypothetical protein